MAKAKGAAPVTSTGDEDDGPPSTADEEDRSSPNDPQVDVATMEH